MTHDIAESLTKAATAAAVVITAALQATGAPAAYLAAEPASVAHFAMLIATAWAASIVADGRARRGRQMPVELLAFRCVITASQRRRRRQGRQDHWLRAGHVQA